MIAVIVFTGLTAWDTQRIKEMYDAGAEPGIEGKAAILGALALYLDFINLFPCRCSSSSGIGATADRRLRVRRPPGAWRRYIRFFSLSLEPERPSAETASSR